eukprot:TRINITY_DN23397_c0_g1_i1.p1 TRINITY_DN23397_c0_g1~~TRINITY_DN23397_c0_g1_i1.p1  ORF type:complete len:209 (-),score=32.97 TRINITY_DN23397_c0_g1_i1:68-694(-)
MKWVAIIVVVTLLVSVWGNLIDYKEELVESHRVEVRETSGGASCNLLDPQACGGNNGSNGVCVHPQGSPIGVFECQCYDQYGGADCSYTRKSQKTAFLLSFFTGTFGADRFYLGYKLVGAIKLIVSAAAFIPGVCLCILRTVLKCCGALKEGRRNIWWAITSFLGALVCCFGLAVGAWWLADWIMIVIKSTYYNDYNGYKLYYDLSLS